MKEAFAKGQGTMQECMVPFVLEKERSIFQL